MDIIQGIYKIENTKTKKIYIGQSKDIYGRFKQHKRELNRGTLELINRDLADLNIKKVTYKDLFE